jgi:hypothetical protein
MAAHTPEYLDAAWVRAHVVDIVRANPELLRTLVDVMRRWSADEAIAAIAELGDADGIDRAAVLRTVRERLHAASRDAVLAAIDRS